MSDSKQPFDLSALENDYDIIGELGATGVGRAFFGTKKDAAAKRRDDNTGVLIEVLSPPAGDEGNALSHLASDAQILMRLSHRRLIPVIEGRWVGKDVLALITRRTTEPTLAQLLTTGETFSNPRTAAILREVNGLLEWAREQKIVHRTITPDRVYLEPKTDRVRVSFAVAPIPRVQRTSAADTDARTIATLAMAMLTGSVDPVSYEGESLTELRPDLPEQLIAETGELLSGKRTDVDVPAYLALVGMADPLAAGETEAERVRAEVLEEQRVEREKLAAERAAFAREMELERQKLAKEGEDLRRQLAMDGETLRAKFQATEEALQKKFESDDEELRKKFTTAEEQLRKKYETDEEGLRKKFTTEEETLRRAVADERAQMERAVEEERKRVAKERAELAAAVAAERALLVAKRAELERGVAERRAELERVAAEDRERIAALRAEIERRGELEVEKKRDAALAEISDEESALDRGEYATPLFLPPVIAPIEPLEFEDTALLRDEDVAFAPVFSEVTPTGASRASRASREVAPDDAADVAAAELPGEPAAVAMERGPGRNRWIVPAGIAGVVVIAAISAGLIGSRRSSTPSAAAPAARAVAAPARPLPTPAATTAPARMDPAAWAAILADSVAARQWLDSLRHASPVDVPWAIDIARVKMERADRARAAAARASGAARPTAAPVVNASGSGNLSTPPGTRAAPPPRDTVVRRDTNVSRPDTATTPPPAIPPL